MKETLWVLAKVVIALIVMMIGFSMIALESTNLKLTGMVIGYFAMLYVFFVLMNGIAKNN